MRLSAPSRPQSWLRIEKPLLATPNLELEHVIAGGYSATSFAVTLRYPVEYVAAYIA